MSYQSTVYRYLFICRYYDTWVEIHMYNTPVSKQLVQIYNILYLLKTLRIVMYLVTTVNIIFLGRPHTTMVKLVRICALLLAYHEIDSNFAMGKITNINQKLICYINVMWIINYAIQRLKVLVMEYPTPPPPHSAVNGYYTDIRIRFYIHLCLFIHY